MLQYTKEEISVSHYNTIYQPIFFIYYYLAYVCITSVRNAQRNCTNQVENTIIAQLYSTSSPLSAFYPFRLHRVLIPYPLRDFPLPYHSMFHLPLRALSSLPLRVISSYTFRGSSSPALRVISNPRSFRPLTSFVSSPAFHTYSNIRTILQW